MTTNSDFYIWSTLICGLLQGVAAIIAIIASIAVFMNRKTIISSINLFRLYAWRREVEKELYRIEKKIEKFSPNPGSSGPQISDLKNEIEVLSSFLRSLKEISGRSLSEEFALMEQAKISSHSWEVISGMRGVIATIRYGQFLGKV